MYSQLVLDAHKTTSMVNKKHIPENISDAPWAAHQWRKAQTSSGVQQSGKPSRCMVVLHPDKIGEDNWVQIEIESASTCERWGGGGGRGHV